jgi:hypothetical protein
MKRSPLIIAAIIFVAILFIGLVASTTGNFNLHQVSPSNNAKNVASDAQISFSFNRDLSSALHDGSSGPNQIIVEPYFRHSSEIINDTLTITPQVRLYSGQTYTVTIKKATAKNGKVIDSVKTQFTIQQDTSVKAIFTKTLPYQSAGYSIDYQTSTDQFIVYIHQKPIDTVQRQALTYIQSKVPDVDVKRITFLIDKGLQTATDLGD